MSFIFLTLTPRLPRLLVKHSCQKPLDFEITSSPWTPSAARLLHITQPVLLRCTGPAQQPASDNMGGVEVPLLAWPSEADRPEDTTAVRQTGQVGKKMRKMNLLYHLSRIFSLPYIIVMKSSKVRKQTQFSQLLANASPEITAQ